MKLPAKWVRQEPLIFRGTTIFRGIIEPLQIIIGIPDKWAKKKPPKSGIILINKIISRRLPIGRPIHHHQR